ncbi:odorant receptor 131-2-like [Bombina bombina]|uniref:odorant receptor 131-2-like n=1 Tax=Bombina bombina TaxID=8345 RepID=UPI00235B29C4|nr:odorant receptor 131-2-like [Bombina bombina]XP_053561587.1 odorant receptor 131-2-like [Bombina bombina]
MENYTVILDPNSKSQTHNILRQVLEFFMVLCLSFYLYFIRGILKVFFSTACVRENARYILFAHMLFSDTLYLVLSIFLHFTATYLVLIPVPICYILVTVSSTTFKVTPYNLAVMSLERYTAICFPLRHAELSNRLSANVAIVLIWVVGLLPNFVDFIFLSSSVDKSYFSLSLKCSRQQITITAAQNNIRFFTHTFTFSTVGLIIIVTYIKIMMVALSIDSNKSASKAGKTVMLHAVQLMLCMLAFSYTLTEMYLRAYVEFMPVLNFAFLMCLPRFLSPLIYGIRDEVFRNYINKFLLCNALKINSGVNSTEHAH